MTAKSLSILIPTHNEEEVILDSLLYLTKFLEAIDDTILSRYEIIICDNASTDNTKKNVFSISKNNSNIKYIGITEKGIGIALHTAITTTIHDFICTYPADCEIHPDFIKDALGKMRENDFILGSRYLAEGAKSSSKTRAILSKAYNSFFKLMFNNGLSEVGTVKMFKGDWARKTNPKCREKSWGWQVEILYHALSDGLNISEVPVTFVKKRSKNESKVNVFPDSLDLFSNTLRFGLMLRLGI